MDGETCQRPWEVLLIGEVSGAGKTTAARELSRRLSIPWLGVDDLRLAFQQSRVSLPEKTEALYFFLDTPDVWSLPPERLRDALIDVAEIMTPAISIVIANHLHNAGPLIIEGDGIHPAIVKQSSLQPAFDQGRVQAIFVHETDANALHATSLARNRAIQGRSNESLLGQASANAFTVTGWLALPRAPAFRSLPRARSQPSSIVSSPRQQPNPTEPDVAGSCSPSIVRSSRFRLNHRDSTNQR